MEQIRSFSGRRTPSGTQKRTMMFSISHRHKQCGSSSLHSLEMDSHLVFRVRSENVNQAYTHTHPPKRTHVSVLMLHVVDGSDDRKSTNTFPMQKYPFLHSLDSRLWMIDRGKMPRLSNIDFGCVGSTVSMVRRARQRNNWIIFR